MTSSDSVADDLLRSGFERWLRLEEEKAAIGDDLKELFAELKGQGFAPKALRESFRRVRNINDADQQEHDAIVDLYVASLTGAHPARTREDDPEHDEDGVIIEDTNSASPPAEAGTAEPLADTQEAVPAPIAETTAPTPLPLGHDQRVTAPITQEQGPAEAKTVDQEPSEPEGSGEVQDECAIHLATPSTVRHGGEKPVDPSSEPANAGGENVEDRGAYQPPAGFRAHNPATHFLNSEGLERLHGCLKPEACGSSQPRQKLCFSCSVKHDGPTYVPGASEPA